MTKHRLLKVIGIEQTKGRLYTRFTLLVDMRLFTGDTRSPAFLSFRGKEVRVSVIPPTIRSLN